MPNVRTVLDMEVVPTVAGAGARARAGVGRGKTRVGKQTVAAMYLDGRRLLAESRGNFIGLIKVLVADEIQLVSKLSTAGKS